MKKLLLTLSMAVLTIVAMAQVSITVNVPAAGGLSAALAAAGGNPNTVTNLTVTGNIDARDIFYMRDNMPVLAVIDMENVMIEAYSSYPANAMPANSFYFTSNTGKTSLTSIKMPTSITLIGEYAFEGCSGIVGNLLIPSSVTSIGNYAFSGCAGLTGNLTFPGSVTSIGRYSFSHCAGLTGNINIPNSIISIGDGPFYDCEKITSITVDDANPKYKSIDGVLFNKTITKLIQCPSGKVTNSYTIPNTTTSIGSCALYNCSNLTGSLTIPNSVTIIGDYAFNGCSGFTGNLTIPNSVTGIGTAAFQFCGGFNGNLTISNSVSFISSYAFCYNNFTGSLTIPKSVTYIANDAFGYCYLLKKIYVDNPTPLSIVSSVFYNVNKSTCELIVPKGAKTAYMNAINWKDFTLIKEGSLVTFNPNGGSAVDNTIAYYDSTIVSKVSEKIGFVLDGWYKETALSTKWDFKVDKVTKDTMLFAKWEAGYTVSFNYDLNNKYIDTTVLNNTNITAPVAPIKMGYTFGGWYKEAACNNAWDYTTDIVTTNTTLYAKWTINSYTVTFNSQGGSTVSNITTDYNTNITAPTAPAKTGYTFGGWYKEIACTNAWNFITDVVTANTTLYAKWMINSYTVAFNSQGGSSVSSKTTNYNTSITAPTAPTLTGYTFGGWYKEAACTNVWNFTTDVVTTNTTLYAKWTINSYTVAFNSKGGSAVSSKTTNYNTSITSPTDPTLTGYTFGGWYKETACTNAWNFTTDIVTANTWLYAKWTINTYTVTFNSQGGSTVSSTTTNYNTSIAAPTAPNLTGYTFGGWYKEATCTNAWSFASDKVTANNTLYAKWVINTYIVTFNSQGGTAVSSTTTNYNTSIAAPIAPTLIGYTFGGWYKEAACNNTWNFASDKVTANTTLYAKWVINTYIVTFNSQGGSAVSSTTTNYNTSIAAPIAPTLIGYTFGGWYKEAACTNAWNFTTDVVTANTTLYAKWVINTFTVTFNSQGGSTISSITTNYNTSIATPTAPFLTGYTFAGWYNEAACTNEWNFASDKVTANTTLYAKWTINSYIVSFNSQDGSAIPSITTNYNTSITAPTTPTLTGYTLAGWYKDAACTNAWNFASDMVTTNTTLYAKWMINSYTVRFMQGHTTVTTQTANYNTTITPPANPVIDGYTFAGWNNANLTKTWNFAIDKITSDTILFAKWMVTISYNMNGGSPMNDVLLDINTLVVEPAAPSKTGFTFAGWYKDANFTKAWVFNTDLATTNTTIYAKWVITTYTVNFNTNGGSALANITANYNSTITTPTEPIKNGYTFAGWYKDVAFTNAWVFNSDLVTSNTTLYAKWADLVNAIPSVSNISMKLYPNPVDEVVTLEGNNMEYATIFNLSGVVVMQLNLQGKDVTRISLGELKSGVYLVHIKTKGGNVSILNLLKR
jgi:uncharacterized repeat protein (TIGR02543 family)